MDEPEIPPPSEATETVDEMKGLNPLQRIIGVFCYPAATFEQVDRRPDWWMPLLIVTAAVLLFTYLILPVSLPQVMAQQEQQMAENGADYQQIEKITEMTAKYGRIFGFLSAGLGTGIWALVASLFFWFIGSVLLRGKTTYPRVLSVYLYASLIGVLDLMLRLPLILAKESADIAFTLALLLPDAQSGTLLYAAAHSFDIFGIWRYVVLAIGFSVIYRFSIQKAGWTMAILWLLTALLSTGMRMLGALGGTG